MSPRRFLLALLFVPLAASAAAALERDEALAVSDRLLQAVREKRYEDAVAMLAPAIRPLLPASRLQQTMEGLEAQLGPYSELPAAAEADLVDGSWRVFKGVKAGSQPLVSLVVVDDEGRVAGYQLLPLEAAARLRAPDGAESTPPVPESPLPERELQVGEGPGALGATLTLPEGEGPHPGLVLVHGSGPNDRDGTLGPNAPLRDLAWGLAERGVAVLRYDKRTKAHPLESAAIQDRLTVKEEVVDDALAAVELLRVQPEVDAGRVALAGHSLGGYLAPRIAARSPHLAGAVLLAAPARPLGRLWIDQVEYLLGLDGSWSEADRAQLASVRAQVARSLDPELSDDTPSSELPLGLSPAYCRDLQGYDPVALARRLPLPLLVLQGDRDYQVSVEEDFSLWRRGLRGRAAPTAFESYPSLNHLLIPGEGPSTPAEYQASGHVDEGLLEDLAAWLHSLPTR